MPAFQNGFSRKVKISADHDDFLTFPTREKSRLAYTDVHLLAVLAWRVISCVCERDGRWLVLIQARTGNRTAQGMGVHCPLRLPETGYKARTAYFYGQEQTAGQHGRSAVGKYRIANKARPHARGDTCFPEFREALKKVPLTCARDGVTFRSQKA